MRPLVSPPTETPVFELKPLSRERIDAALAKAEHYRFLNQPSLAESICLDILTVEPGHQKASIVLLLALTDQFGQPASKSAKQVLELANRLKEDYARIYYTGIVHERQGTATLNAAKPGYIHDAYEWYSEAMGFYEQANKINKESNDDPILRWNTCARVIMEHHLQERPFSDREEMLE
jgi:hypothetical protein